MAEETDNYEKLCEDLIKALTNNSLPLVERWMKLKGDIIVGKPEVVQLPTNPSKTDILKHASEGSTVAFDLNAGVKRADLGAIEPKPTEDNDLF